MATRERIVERWHYLRGLLIEQLDAFESGALKLHANDINISVSAIENVKSVTTRLGDQSPPRLTIHCVEISGAFALDHGIFVGSKVAESATWKTKYCRYFFVTGFSWIEARDGEVMKPAPARGYCRLFAE